MELVLLGGAESRQEERAALTHGDRGKVPELLPTACRQQKTTATTSSSALFLVLIRAEARPGARRVPKGERHRQP